MKTAFLIIDMQNQFHEEMRLDPYFPTAIEHINYVADLMRTSNQNVIIIKDTEGFKEKNDPELDFVEEVKVEKTDIIIQKEFSNAFWKTSLEATLKELDVDYLIISGFAAEHCVLGTFLGAKERGFTTAILQNGVISTKPEAVSATYRDREIVSYSTLEYLLKAISIK